MSLNPESGRELLSLSPRSSSFSFLFSFEKNSPAEKSTQSLIIFTFIALLTFLRSSLPQVNQKRERENERERETKENELRPRNMKWNEKEDYLSLSLLFCD